MPVYKSDNGTWYVLTRYLDWKGERKQKCKRGFETRKEAVEWERTFQQQNAADMDMTFEAFFELYANDIKPRLKENTWLTKEHIVETKIMPYFAKRIFKGQLCWVLTAVSRATPYTPLGEPTTSLQQNC